MPSPTADTWSDQQLLATFASYAGTGDDADQPEPVRFLRGVARLVKKRISIDTGQALLPAVFLLSPSPPVNTDTAPWQSHPMLDNGLTSVVGQLWFVSPVVASGFSMPLEFNDDAQMFNFVVDQIDHGEVPAVIYDPRTKPAQIRFYPDGLSKADNCQTVNVPAEFIALTEVFEAIDEVHKVDFITPDAQMSPGKLWENADRYWPMANAELRIQMQLKTGLCLRFPTCTIRYEQPDVTGRLDIEIEGRDPERPGWFIRYAVLELKVLRSYGSTGSAYSDAENSEWVKKGVEQAYAYRQARGALASALCCFDMRKSHEDIQDYPQIAEEALKLGVTIKFWCLYSSSQAYRAYLAANND